MVSMKWLFNVILMARVINAQEINWDVFERQHMINRFLFKESWPKGFVIDTEECSSEQTDYIKRAFPTIRELVDAASASLKSNDAQLFNFFFRPNDKRSVSRAFGKLSRIADEKMDIGVIFKCKDRFNICNRPNNPIATFLNFIPQKGSKISWRSTPRNNMIELCPIFFNLPKMTMEPCSPQLDMATGDGPALAQVLLHEMLHLPFLVGPKVDALRDIVHNPWDAHNLVDLEAGQMHVEGLSPVNVNPQWSVNNYLFFATWAWKMQQMTQHCPEQLSTSIIANVLRSSSDRDELRKLLSVPDNPEPEVIPQTDVTSLEMPANNSFGSDAHFTNFNASGELYSEGTGLSFAGINVTVDPPASPITIEYDSPQTSAAAPHQCSGTCTSVTRQCAWAFLGECKCTAPAVNLFLWTGSCSPVVKAPNGVHPRDLESPSAAASDDMYTDSSGWKSALLNTTLPANSTSTANSTSNSSGTNAIAAAGSPGGAIYELAGYYYYLSTGKKTACPCNTTCVSYGCCASNGTIWEPRDACLDHGKMNVS